MSALEATSSWDADHGVPNVAAAVVRGGTVVETAGDVQRVFQLASVTKLLTAYAVLIAVEEEAFGLDDAAGPPGATVRHLLSHTAGYGFESGSGVVSRPGARRIYSNAGIEVLAEHLAEVTGIPFGEYLSEAVLEPLGMRRSRLLGSPAHAVHSTVEDLAAFAAELHAPGILAPATLQQATTIQFPGLSGVLPGVRRFDPLDWGLGFERNFGKPGHWSGDQVSTGAFGHFGGAGTFLWHDPERSLAAICLTDLRFGPWALDAWPPLCEEIIRTYGSGM